jgi:murein L,D-transpeptidase YafK
VNLSMKKWIFRMFLVLVLIGLAYNFIPEAGLPKDKKIEKLVVIKSKRIMEVYSGGEVIKTYHVALGKNPGDKVKKGDKRTPEGAYRINSKNPNSGFHKNLGISYPGKEDMKEALQRNVNPGGDIKIHGLKNGLGFIKRFHRFMNWTAGCIAVTNNEVDELYERVEIGTPIIIKP